jgi:hypothetical protein
MIKIDIPVIAAPISKFQRPAFGNGRFYMSTAAGSIVAYGAPIALPLNCSSPINFGQVIIGSSSTIVINCTALVNIAGFRGLVIGRSIYQALNSSLPTSGISSGSSFSFPVTFNLTNLTLTAGSSSAPAVSPGIQTTGLNILTTISTTKFSNQVPITLTGVAASANPFPQIAPSHIIFPGIVLGSTEADQGSVATFTLGNLGQANLTILGYSYSDSDGSFKNITLKSPNSTTYALDDNGYFTSLDLPSIGSIVLFEESLTIDCQFQTNSSGTFSTLLTFWTDGGSVDILLTGSANNAAIAVLEYSTSEGGWNEIPDCSDPSQECMFQIGLGTSSGSEQLNITLRLTNTGGSDLIITKSKPPEGIVGATNPDGDFAEGLEIPPGNHSTATIVFQPGGATLNSDPVTYFGDWILNTNDLLFGVHDLNFTAILSPLHTGPVINGTNSPRFKWLGCYQDNVNARLFPTVVNPPNNTNGVCQNDALADKSVFAATEYTVSSILKLSCVLISLC